MKHPAGQGLMMDGSYVCTGSGICDQLIRDEWLVTEEDKGVYGMEWYEMGWYLFIDVSMHVGRQ
jgi:hypothetical protein